MSLSSPPTRTTVRRRLVATLAATAVVIPALVVATPAASAPLTSLNTEFVTREGSELRLGGERFRASGTNIYWLGLDENVGGVDFPTYFRIKDALDTAKQLGINVVRSHMMTSTGQDNANPLALMPALGEYNDEAFKTIDFAIAYAGSIGIRLILPVTDEWEYYHGGHRDFTTPLGLESADFYTDRGAIEAFQEYVDLVVNHVNPYTGLRLADDPTILAWELGNELEGMTLEWIDEQVAFIRDRAPEQLIAAGRRFDIDPDTLQSAELDIVDVHYYPPTAARVSEDAATVAAAGKVYIGGEYASTAATDAVLQPVADDPNVSGMFFWSLFGNHDRGGLVPHDDGFTLHYPGTTDRMRTSVDAIKRYSTALGLGVDQLAVEAPLVVAIDQTNAINRISWRGTAGAVGYQVQRAVDGGSWTDVGGVVGAEASPLTDLESPPGASYRVLAITTGGDRVGSDPVQSVPLGSVLVDPLADWSLTAAHSDAQIVAPSGAEASGPATAVWNIAGIDTAAFRLSSGDDVTISSSNDGETWADEVTETISGSGSGLTTVTATGIQKDFVRVAWPTSTILDRATISSSDARVALFDPLDDFSQAHSYTGSLSFDTGNPNLFGGDTSRLKRDAADGAESITWTYDDISGADIVAYAWPDQPAGPLVIESSADGSTWTEVAPEVLGGDGNWRQFTYRLRDLVGVNYLRVSWADGDGEVWTPQLSQVSIYSPNAPELGAPSSVALIDPADQAIEIQSTPVFRWNPSADAAYYRFILATNPNLTDPAHSTTGLVRTSYQPPIDLTPETTYYWRVDAVNGLGDSASSTWSFTTDALPTEPLVLDDFESYADDDALTAAYPPNTGGGDVVASLTTNETTGSAAARFAFDLGSPGYAGVIHELPVAQNLWGYRGLGLTLTAPVGVTVSVQFVAAGGYWETQVPITEAGPAQIEIPFDRFAPPAWAGESRLDLSTVTQYALYVADVPVGELVVDDVVALAPLPSEPDPDPEPTAGPTQVPAPEPTTNEPTGPTAPPGGGDPTDPGNPTDVDEPDAPGTDGDPVADDDPVPPDTLPRTGAHVATLAALAAALVLLGLFVRRQAHQRQLLDDQA